jgi:drug/metabolite transporter (DMT)-like permease
MSSHRRVRQGSGPSTPNVVVDTARSAPFTLPAIFHLSVVYVVWGSTYLAMRIAVRDGFEPFTVGLTRAVVSGAILLGLAALARQRLRLTRHELTVLSVSGLLLWTGGNGLVLVAVQRVDSSLAALVVASIPIWVALMEALTRRRLPSLRLTLALVLGFAGIVALSYPLLRDGVRADALSVLCVIAGAMSWSAGTLLQTRNRVDLSPQVSSSVQMLAGGAGFVVLRLIVGEPWPSPGIDAALAWSYLVIVGGVLAFTSYITVLRLLPISIVTTHAYVNPVIAIILGWLVVSEPITGWTIAGSALVLLGVAGVFRARSLGQITG